MSYKICATKRDVNTVGKPLQYFTPSQWIVRISTGSNAGDYNISDTYLLIKDGEVTSLTCSIPLTNGCVYEGMQVSVGSGTKLSFGTLLQKEAANQCVTKEKVLNTNCGLTGESAMYASNRLVREEDIVAPSTVSVYYDPRYLTVEEFKTDAVWKAPTTSVDPGAPERTPGDELGPLMNREFAYLSILCTKGNKIKVIQKSTVNSDLVLNAVYAYDNLAAPMYELNAPGHEGAEFIASETCFITFDLVLQTYRLSAAAPVIDCATKWGLTISAYIEPDGDVHYLASSGMDDPNMPMCRPSEEEYMVVPNEAEVNVSLHVNTYETANTTTFILRNLTTNETTTLTLNDDNECIFKMPSSDCRLETNVVIHETTGDTGFEYEDRILTIKSSLLERVVVNGSTYSFYDGVAEVLVPCEESPSALAEVYFDAGITAVYSIRAYATSQGPVSMPRSQSSPNTTLSLSTDMTLEISYSPVSCKYSSLSGKIATLDKYKMWDNDTTITNVSLSPSGYLLSTSLSITSSPSDNLFSERGTLIAAEFYTNSPTFDITRLAFTDCSGLHEVVLPNTNLTIGEQAFDKCSSLSKLELPSGLYILGNQVFGNNAYKAIYTNPSYIDTSGQINALTFNVDDSYNSSLTELPKFTFEFCKNLEEVYLPASITTIKKGAFLECDNLKHFASPGLKIIELEAFKGTWIEESYNYNNLEHDGGGLAHKDGTTGIYFYYPLEIGHTRLHVNLIKPDPEKEGYILYKRPVLFPGAGFSCYFNIPIISISDYGFAKNDVIDYTNPYSIDFNAYSPNSSIKYIGDYAFKECGADVIDLHWGKVEYLGEGAFYKCGALKSLTGFENAPITTIKPYTFYKCGGDVHGIGATFDPQMNALKTNVDFYIPNTTTEIGSYAFAGCRQLMGIANIDGCRIHTIGDYAFENCFRNTAYRTLEGLRIGGEAFVLAVLVAAIILSWGTAGAAAVENLSGTAAACFDKLWNFGMIGSKLANTKITLFMVLGCGGGTVAVGGAGHHMWRSLPTRVEKRLENTGSLMLPWATKIGVGAFKDCRYLGVVSLNKNITEIPDDAFNNCKRLAILGFADTDNAVVDESSKKVMAGTVVPQDLRIGKRAFKNCNNFIESTLHLLLAAAVEIDEEAFKSAKLNKDKAVKKSVSSFVLNPQIRKLAKDSLSFDNDLYIIIPKKDTSDLIVEGYPFSTKHNVSVYVPDSALLKYTDLFGTHQNLTILPISDDDYLWFELKAAGLDIPWVEGQDDAAVEYVDLGLSVKWSSRNLGAILPKSLGARAAWAMPTLCADDEDEEFKIEYMDRECTGEYDVVTQAYGDKFRLPTDSEFEELINNCTWDWDVSERGYYITGPNGNSIFLPTEKPKLKGEDNWTIYRTCSKGSWDIPLVVYICKKASVEKSITGDASGRYAYYLRPVYIGD